MTISFYSEEMAYETNGLITKTTLDYDPAKYKTAEAAAKALYGALVAKYGKGEVAIYSPEETAKNMGDNYAYWWVAHEAGEYDWAVEASFKVAGNGWHTEPYYGFDLMFFEDDE